MHFEQNSKNAKTKPFFVQRPYCTGVEAGD